MTKDEAKAVLEGVPTWPEDRQQELAETAVEIEAELAGAEYQAPPDELAAIDEGLSGEAVSEEEVDAAFARVASLPSYRYKIFYRATGNARIRRRNCFPRVQ